MTTPESPAVPLVVGTIHSPGALKRALRLKPGQVDLLELRVDAFASDPSVLLKAVSGLPAPVLVTVRHPKEGGAAPLSVAQRRVLFGQFLPIAQWMDVEVRSLGILSAEIAHAAEMGVRLIVSDHHFQRTPSLEALRGRLQRARSADPEVFKLAATLRSARDLEVLLAFLNGGRAGSLAVMGMGGLGKVSRLLLGKCGSVLNYGYLDQPQVPGQWEATLLKERLRELL